MSVNIIALTCPDCGLHFSAAYADLVCPRCDADCESAADRWFDDDYGGYQDKEYARDELAARLLSDEDEDWLYRPPLSNEQDTDGATEDGSCSY